MFTVLIIFITLIAILITLIILVQSGKGGGLAGIAAGGATQQILGARQAPDVLEKATWILATLFFVFCILTNFAIDRDEVQESVIQQRAREEQAPTLPPAGQQQLPESQQLPPGGQQPQNGTPEGGN